MNMDSITLDNFFQELKGQTFCKSLNVAMNGCTLMFRNCQVYKSGEVHVRTKEATMSLNVALIEQVLVRREDLGDGLIITEVMIMTK